jgi:hypothetical protein
LACHQPDQLTHQAPISRPISAETAAERVHFGLRLLERQHDALHHQFIAFARDIEEMRAIDSDEARRRKCESMEMHPAPLAQVQRTLDQLQREELTGIESLQRALSQTLGAAQELSRQRLSLCASLDSTALERDQGVTARLTLDDIGAQLEKTAGLIVAFELEASLIHERNDERLHAVLRGRDGASVAARTRVELDARLFVRCALPPAFGLRSQPVNEWAPDCRHHLQNLNADLRSASLSEHENTARFWTAAYLRSGNDLADQGALIVNRLAGGRAKTRELEGLARRYLTFEEDASIFFGAL